MAWFKRNLFIVVIIAIALCAVTALALETIQNSGARPLTPVENSGANVTGKEFQNRPEPAKEPVKAWPEYGKYSDYELALVLDPAAKQMRGTMNFTYLNDEDQPMSELHFLLYANSHEKQYYGIFEAKDMDSAYPNGFSPGFIEIKSVTAADGKAEYIVSGDQNHVLQVRLPRAVAVGQTARLTIEYTVTIPNCYGRFGYGEDTMSLVNCNPILSVFNDGKWYDYPYYSMGDPFYSETANYKATITAPKEWTIAATGVLNRREKAGEAVWTVDAPARRDFGFVASDDFEVMQTEVDGVLVRSYYLEGDKSYGREALDTGAESIKLYNETFGQYPYAEFSVVETNFFIGGMEYPGMVMIDQSLYNAFNTMVLDLVVAHETGHQWWYSTVGDNEVMEPWLDEGLTEFTTQYFFEKERDASFNNYYKGMNESYQAMRGSDADGHAVTLPSYYFDDGITYSAWVYDRTAQILMELRQEIGGGQFYAALKEYYNDNRLGITSRDDFEKAFEDASGRELTQWFEQRFNATGEPAK